MATTTKKKKLSTKTQKLDKILQINKASGTVSKNFTLIFIPPSPQYQRRVCSQFFNPLTLPQLNESDQHFSEETVPVAELVKAVKAFLTR